MYKLHKHFEFSTLQITSSMKISFIVSPSSRPLIEGMQTHYKPGDLVNISCICPDSFPAANISWFINGSKVTLTYMSVMSFTVFIFRRNHLELKTAAS